MPIKTLIRALVLSPFLAGGGAGLALSQSSLSQYDLDDMARIVQEWLDAPHGDYTSLSFTYWNKDGAVPENCAACHSQPGFIAYLGADGSPFGAVEHPAAINAPIGCASCHTDTAHALDAVPFPSGVVTQGHGASAVCTVCHQGRLSGDDVDAATATLDEDDVSGDLGFMNIHYGIAAAVMAGSDVRGGYQYPGQSYAGTFAHVPSANTCAACHDVHTTQVEDEGCLSCHRGVDNLRDIRTQHRDFDGDGDIATGIHGEITGLRQQLLTAIQIYARDVAGTPVGYAPGQFPYFFTDADGDGRIGPEEGGFPNRYQNWTPRLLKAAYNYQVATKDPGGYVHNPRYVLQLLHDSLADLATVIPLDITGRPRP